MRFFEAIFDRSKFRGMRPRFHLENVEGLSHLL